MNFRPSLQRVCVSFCQFADSLRVSAIAVGGDGAANYLRQNFWSADVLSTFCATHPVHVQDVAKLQIPQPQLIDREVRAAGKPRTANKPA